MTAIEEANRAVEEYAALDRAIGGVLFNVSNFPEAAQARLLGQNMRPLNEKLADAVLAAGFRLPAAPSADEREVLEAAGAKAFKEWWDSDDTRGVGQIIADAVLGVDFRRQGPVTAERITIRHVGGNTLTGTVEQVLSTHLAAGWALDGVPVIECPHWAPGTITPRNGCTACAAEAGRSGS